MVTIATPAADAARGSGPDLLVRAVSAPPAQVNPGASFTMFDTTRNGSKTVAPKSLTGYYLSANATKDGSDLRIGRRTVGKLKPGKRSAGSARLRVPAITAIGSYTVIVCADDGRKLKESNERNNCKIGPTKLNVGTAPRPTETPVLTPTPNATPQPQPTPPAPSADLSVTMSHGGPARAGNPLTFTVVVRNAGPDPAESATMADTLPSGLTLTSLTPSAGTCTQASGTVSCSFGTLASGASVTTRIELSSPGNTSAQTYTNSASATTTTNDPNPANSAASDSPLVEGWDHQVATASFAITRQDSCANALGRLCESHAGNVIADAIRAAGGANFSLIDAGAIRADITCPASSSIPGCPASYSPPPFTIVRATVHNTLPFGNLVATLNVSGTELWGMLEHGVAAEPGPAAAFLHVGGLCFTYDVGQPVGSRVTGVFTANQAGCTGTAVPKDGTQYTIATSDALAGGGNGYPNFSARATYNGRLSDTVEDYLAAKGNYSQPLQGRIDCTSATGCP
jgi:uncharacterized repeat protein (TIGR01451 family)